MRARNRAAQEAQLAMVALFLAHRIYKSPFHGELDVFGLKSQKAFWQRVTVLGRYDCWLWSTHPRYGSFRRWPVHRWIWQFTYGSLDSNCHIHHCCLVKSCVNPRHLMQLTPESHFRIHVEIERWQRATNTTTPTPAQMLALHTQLVSSSTYDSLRMPQVQKSILESQTQTQAKQELVKF